jgi:pimeloyl-ACP methyl ester carboxylesterase
MCTWDAAVGFEQVSPSDTTWRNELCARAGTAPPYHLQRRARRISCPALYCIAEDDEVNPPELGERVAGSVPGGEVRRYPGGHLSPFLGETFERMAADQVEFLRRRLGLAGSSR